MAVELGTTTLFALILLLINGGLQWIREMKKGSTWRSNGKDLKVIKDSIKSVGEKVDCLDGKVGDTKVKIAEMKTAVLAQKEQCGKTVDRFDAAITNQYDHLIKLAKGRK